MAAAVTVRSTWSDGKRQHVVGTIALSGNYATGGDAIVWTDPQIKSANAPLVVHVDGTSGWIFKYDRANSKLLVFEQDAGAELAQIAAAGYPAGVSSDVIDFEAIFDQNR